MAENKSSTKNPIQKTSKVLETIASNQQVSEPHRNKQINENDIQTVEPKKHKGKKNQTR